MRVCIYDMVPYYTLFLILQLSFNIVTPVQIFVFQTTV